MRVLLLQLDGSLPNLALMCVSAFHKARGDDVVLEQARSPQAVERGLFDDFGRVYASLIFEKTRPVAKRLLQVYPRAVVGGTGWNLQMTLEGLGINALPDYSIYSGFRQSMGFTQRGCRLECPFCVVPRKEGKVRGVATVADVWRGEPWPRELILLDNDFFGQADWRLRVREMVDGGFKVNFNQGINARMLSDEAAEAIASLDCRNAAMKTRAVYTAWDNRRDEEVLFRGLGRLVKYGVKPDDITVYILVEYWDGETDEEWLYRAVKLREFGCRPYPMPYRRGALALAFQRWVVGAYDKPTNANHVPWREWKAAKGDPRLVGRRRRVSLPLFGEGG